jgi:hypothetical protein
VRFGRRLMIGVRIRVGAGRSHWAKLELHEDQARAVRMLLGDEEPTVWLIFFLRERHGVGAVLATAVWKMRHRAERRRAEKDFVLTSPE